MAKRTRIPPSIRKALDATGLGYEIATGGRHFKILVSGRFVGILPFGKHVESYGSEVACKNTVSQIRRVAKELKGAAND